MDNCKHCGACQHCEPCDHCGHCRKCGQYAGHAHFIPYPIYPVYPQPNYPWCQPSTITYGAISGGISSSTYQGGLSGYAGITGTQFVTGMTVNEGAVLRDNSVGI